MKKPPTPKRIGFLATGSEIVAGEILNTNGQMMAQILLEHGMELGEHLVCDDDLNNLKASTDFLLSRHQAVIMTGGLGPTSDDCTRDILAEISHRPLTFDEASWQAISTRIFNKKGYVPESNKRQAFFPQGASIFKNDHGSAPGFYLNSHTKDIFALPGPPKECKPMFEAYVLPLLLEKGYCTEKRLIRWIVTGIAEAQVHEALLPIAEQFNLTFAYRASSPHIHIKLWIAQNHPERTHIETAVLEIIQAYLIT